MPTALKFIAYRMADSPLPAAQVPAERITHLNHAFAKIDDSGNLASGYPERDLGPNPAHWERNGSNFGEYLQLKGQHPPLKTLLSVGGWEWSHNISDLAADGHYRRRFCRGSAEYLERFGFDGIDVDWEYPTGGGHAHNSQRGDDLVNYTALIEDLREALERRSAGQAGRRFLLSAATSASAEETALMDFRRLGQAFDFINVMSYDYGGEWDGQSSHHAALFPRGQAAIEAHLKAGMPAGQLNLGLPFYGRQWRVTGPLPDPPNPDSDPANVELRLPGWGAKAPPAIQTGLGAGITWREIQALSERGQLFEDHQNLAAWLFIDWETEQKSYPNSLPAWELTREHPPAGRVISFDSPAILAAKVAWAKARGLGGVMCWELGGDDNGQLVDAIWKGLQA